MQYNLLGKTGLNVSRLSFGASSLGAVFRPVDESEAIKAVHAALDCGINYFDVAPAYGGTLSETVLGKALRGVPRMLAESRRYAAQKILCSIPSLGPVRAALLMALLGTPHRFRGKRQLWTYAGLALVTRSSADYRVANGELVRSRQPALVLGLNANHNHELKALFKDAAASALAHPGPLREFYNTRVDQGMKPELARLTLARKIAAIALTL
jgi:hypothetical protein